MATVTIRVPQATHQLLVELAQRRRRPIGEIVTEAARRLDEDDFWAAVNADFARLRADPVASAEYDAEVAAWDTLSLMDFNEPPYEGIEELLASVAERDGEGR